MRCVCLSYTNEQIIPTEFDNNDLITPLAWGLARIQEALPAGCSRTSQELTEGPQLRDADAVLPFPQQVPPDRELEAPLHAVDAVPRDRVAAAELRRREHHPIPPRAAPVDEHLNSESKRKRIRVQ